MAFTWMVLNSCRNQKNREETADELKILIDGRSEKISDFNDEKRENLRNKVEEESPKAIDMIEEQKERNN